MEIRLAGAEFFRADRQADRHDETDSRFFLQFRELFLLFRELFFCNFANTP